MNNVNPKDQNSPQKNSLQLNSQVLALRPSSSADSSANEFHHTVKREIDGHSGKELDPAPHSLPLEKFSTVKPVPTDKDS